MAISRGQMNRQLYAEGGIKSLIDIIRSNPDKFMDILNILEDVPSEVMGGPYMGRPPKRMPKKDIDNDFIRRIPEEDIKNIDNDFIRRIPEEDIKNIDNDFIRRYRQGRPEMKPETDEEVMERLMELQKNPEYQYDEENMYEGPRDMRMGGGIMNVPIVNNRIHAFGGFGGIVSGIGKAVGSVAKGIGSAVKSASGLLDPVAQIASFVPGPHQPFAAAYTAGRGAGIGGDYGGFQIGGFTPSGGFGGFGGGSSPFTSAFQSGAGQTPGIFSGGNLNLGDIGRLANMARQVSDTGDYGSTIENERIYGQTDGIFGPMGRKQTKSSGILGAILSPMTGKILQGGLSAYAGYKAMEDQKRINEAQQREYENYRKQRAEKMRQYTTGEGLQSMDVRNRVREKADVVARPGVMGGGMMDLDIRTNPQGVKEIDYRKKGGFVPPIGIKEKADDIPAMLSNNEFVFTADAVRGAGKGNVNKGAKKMYTLMKKLEAGGKA